VRLVFPIFLAFVVLRELGELHAVDADGNFAELLSHIYNHLLFAALVDGGLSEGGCVLVLGSEVAHLPVFNSSLGVLVRFEIGFVFLKFFEHSHSSVLGESNLGTKLGGCDVFERLSGFNYFVLRILDNICQSSLLASCHTVLSDTFVNAVVERLLH